MMQEQQYDIVTAMLQAVRDVLGDAFPEDAEKILEQMLRQEWGGQAVYVKKTAVDIEARALAIRTRYNMVNRRQLQAEFGITRGHFYKILRGG